MDPYVQLPLCYWENIYNQLQVAFGDLRVREIIGLQLEPLYGPLISRTL